MVGDLREILRLHPLVAPVDLLLHHVLPLRLDGLPLHVPLLNVVWSHQHPGRRPEQCRDLSFFVELEERKWNVQETKQGNSYDLIYIYMLNIFADFFVSLYIKNDVKIIFLVFLFSG